MNVRDRIVELRRVPASSLAPNPRNWRKHPKAQHDALRGVLAEVGIADAVLARQRPDGVLELVDGHLRAETLGDGEVLLLSARTGQGLGRLESLVGGHLGARSEEVLLRVPAADGRTLSQLRACGALLEEEWLDEGQQYQLLVRLDPALRGRVAREALPGLVASRDGGRTYGDLVPKPPRPEWA